MRVRFGDFELDSETHELLRKGENVPLSRKGFRLLEMLIVRRPAVVTQQELYDALWPQTYVDVANLHNRIAEVRAAIGDREHTTIRTTFGVGFSFAAEATEVTRARRVVPGVEIVIGSSIFALKQGSNVIGRAADADVRVVLPSISRHHARLTVNNDRVVIEDLGSKNGTFVAGARIDSPVPLESGSEFRLGVVHGRLAIDQPTASVDA